MSQCDRLERRVCLSSSLSSGVLNLVGNDSANVFTIDLVDTRLRVRESGRSDAFYPASAVTKIAADLRGGNDRLTLASAVTQPATVLAGSGNDTIVGGSGNDSLVGGDGNDSLAGGSGDDVLKGGSGNDMLRGDAGVDALFGEGGSDTLDGGAANDYLDGGTGNDTIDYSSRRGTVTAGFQVNVEWSDTRHRWFLDPKGSGGEGTERDTYYAAETLVGGRGHDRLSFAHGGSIGQIQMDPTFSLGRYQLVGGPGNDVFSPTGYYDGLQAGRTSAVSCYGGDGDDTFHYGATIHPWFFGQNGNDTFRTAEDDSFAYIDGGSGYDTHHWTNIPGSTYTIDPGVEAFFATGGTFTIYGNALNNRIRGDMVALVDGRGGNDSIAVSASNGRIATIRGGDGNDVLWVENGGTRDAPVLFEGGNGNDSLIGSIGNDTLRGGSGHDTLRAIAGDDQLFGDDGNDVLYGGSGNDTLTGGLGNDTLYGDAGNDTFYARDSAADRLFGGAGTDRAQVDAIDLRSEIEILI